MDFAEAPFGPMPGLLAMADTVEKLTGVCMVCGSDDGYISHRIVPGERQLVVGDAGEYQVRCRACHECRKPAFRRAPSPPSPPPPSLWQAGLPPQIQEKMKVWMTLNPNCGTARNVLAILRGKGIEAANPPISERPAEQERDRGAGIADGRAG